MEQQQTQCYLLQVIVDPMTLPAYTLDLLVCTSFETAKRELNQLNKQLETLKKKLPSIKVPIKNSKEFKEVEQYELDSKEMYKFFLKKYNIDNSFLLEDNRYKLETNIKTVNFLSE